jgi:[ribosomal protein S5]-alanine N-acetyltransferase
MGAPTRKSVWSITAAGGDVECRIRPGRAGLELIVERGSHVLNRNICPDHSSARERASALHGEYDEVVCREEQQPWLSTPTCALRPWRASDAPALATHANSPTIGRNLRDGFPCPFTLDDARAFIERAARLVPLCRFAIAVQGEAVGSIGFTLHPNVERVSAEMGYWLGEAFWGRGIMTDAVRAQTRYAISTHGLTRVYAVPYEWNPASFRVLEKAGFVCEGRMRRSAIKDAQVLDQLLYAFAVSEPGNPDTVLAD